MGQDFYQVHIQPYASIIVKVCRAYTYNQADFDDYYQEVCLQIWRSKDRFKGGCSWTTWIYKITLNVCLTYVRKEVNNKKVVSLDTEQVFDSYFQSGSNKEDIISLYNAIHKLADIDRAIILLYLESFSNKEIAEVIGVTANNIGVRIARIKQKLNKLLETGELDNE